MAAWMLIAGTLMGGYAVVSGAADAPAHTPKTSRISPGALKGEGRGGWDVYPDGTNKHRHVRGRHIPTGSRASKRWHANLVRGADNTVAGDIAVEVAGKQVIQHGAVHARAEHGRIFGKILDDQGQQAATFEGVMGADGVVQGKFTARNDETGTFTWDGVLPTSVP
jgi:hypothetical protein